MYWEPLRERLDRTTCQNFLETAASHSLVVELSAEGPPRHCETGGEVERAEFTNAAVVNTEVVVSTDLDFQTFDLVGL